MNPNAEVISKKQELTGPLSLRHLKNTQPIFSVSFLE
jgi:hypothetical protein